MGEGDIGGKSDPDIFPRMVCIGFIVGYLIGSYNEHISRSQSVFSSGGLKFSFARNNKMQKPVVSCCGAVVVVGCAFMIAALYGIYGLYAVICHYS